MFALSTYRRPAGSLTNWVDEFLNSEFRSRDLETSWTPRVDIVEEDNAYRVRADLPGLEKKDVDVTVENGIMTIRGERKFERTDKKDNSYEYYERRYGSFSRSFNLPENVDSTGIEATYRNGVLDITLPKSEKAKPKQVEIKLR
jgi:HSP20 family protein